MKRSRRRTRPGAFRGREKPLRLRAAFHPSLEVLDQSVPDEDDTVLRPLALADVDAAAVEADVFGLWGDHLARPEPGGELDPHHQLIPTGRVVAFVWPGQEALHLLVREEFWELIRASHRAKSELEASRKGTLREHAQEAHCGKPAYRPIVT